MTLAGRIEQLNKDYNSQILISEDVMHQIDHPLPVSTKFIGNIDLKRMASPFRYIQDHIIKIIRTIFKFKQKNYRWQVNNEQMILGIFTMPNIGSYDKVALHLVYMCYAGFYHITKYSFLSGNHPFGMAYCLLPGK